MSVSFPFPVGNEVEGISGFFVFFGRGLIFSTKWFSIVRLEIELLALVFLGLDKGEWSLSHGSTL